MFDDTTVVPEVEVVAEETTPEEVVAPTDAPEEVEKEEGEAVA